MPTIKLRQETYNKLGQRIERELKAMMQKAKTQEQRVKLLVEVAQKRKGITYDFMISKLLNRKP